MTSWILLCPRGCQWHGSAAGAAAIPATAYWAAAGACSGKPALNTGKMGWYGAPLEARAEDGTVRWSGHYTSWGEVIRQSDGFLYSPGKPQTLYQPLRYAGQYADDETGLHYNLFRYYDPMVGRFTTQDPVGRAKTVYS